MVGLDPDKKKRIKKFIDRYPCELSGGQQQTSRSGKSLCGVDSEIILMDEPFSALDPNN